MSEEILVARINVHNGMGEREVRSAEKNSDGAPAGSSGLPSLSDLAEP